MPRYRFKFCTDNESLLEYVLITSHVHRPPYQYSCTDNEACTDKFCTDSESQKGGSRYRYCTDNETPVYKTLGQMFMEINLSYSDLRFNK